MNTPAVTADLMIHVRADAMSRVTVHADENRVVLGLRDAHHPCELVLFLDRPALATLHALTGSALAELTNQQAAHAATTTTAESAA